MAVRSDHQADFLIVDGHPVHKAREVREWLECNRKRIRQFFLPPYSPHLNPDELLNQDVKTNAVGRRRAQAKSEWKNNVRQNLRKRQRQPETVKAFFQQENLRDTAANVSHRFRSR